jgi:hypothetical protein
MDDWSFNYHQVLLVRLAGLALLVLVFGPLLWLLARAGVWTSRRIMQCA